MALSFEDKAREILTHNAGRLPERLEADIAALTAASQADQVKLLERLRRSVYTNDEIVMGAINLGYVKEIDAELAALRKGKK